MIVTVAVNYYNNVPSLLRVLECFRTISAAAPGFFEFIVVDDHSPEVPDLAIFEGVENLRLFRVTEDVAWNMPGARNICALEARSKQILFMDVDHLIEENQLQQLMSDSAALQRGQRLTAQRVLASGQDAGAGVKPNINCFLIHRPDFFRAGGYEEDFAGSYGQEDKYFKYCCKWNQIKDEPSNFTLAVGRGGSTKLLDRDKRRNEMILEFLISNKIIKPRKAFTFNYERVI